MLNHRRTSLVLSGLACAVIAQTAAFAQVGQTSGALRGIVSEKHGAFVEGATVTLHNLESGATRTVKTDLLGYYAFPLVPVGPYELTVSAPGLRTGKDSHVRVSLGQTSVLNFDLDKATAEATVEVIAATEALDTHQVNTITSVDQKMVESIPLNGRNFTDLVALTPGAAPDPDNGRVSVEGARGVQNNLTIDGASYNSNFFGEQRGSTRIPFAFGADTIKELQIITNAFDAQYGNAAGAVINAVSKSGTNEFSGSTLIQVRPKALVSKIRPVPYDPAGTINTDKARTKNFSQEALNVNFGGPIIKDKLHFFVGVETYHYKEDFTPSFGIGGANTAANLATFLGQDSLGNIDNSRFGKLLVGTGRTLADESGRTYTNDRKNSVYFGRLDWQINENHRATLRVNAQDWKSENGTTSFTSSFAATTGQTNQGLEKNSGLSWVVELNSILGSNLINEARVQRAIERRPRYANSTTSPEFSVNGGFAAGQNNFLPNGLDEYSWQLIDTLTWNQGDWLVKGGVDLQFFDFANTFYRYQNGQFSFSNYQTAVLWSQGALTNASNARLQYQGATSNFGGTIAYKSKLLAGFLQGQYNGLLEKRLSLNLGLRVTKEDQPENPRPNTQFAGLDQANDTTSYDPRFGFTYDLDGKGKTLLKGGYGWFSNPNPSLTVSNTMNQNGNTTSTYLITSSGANAALLATFNSGALSYGQRVTNGGATLSAVPGSLLGGLTTASRVGQVWDPRNKMSVAKRTSIGIEHACDNGVNLGLRGVYVKFENLQYFVNINLRQLDAAGNPDPNGYYNDGYPTTNNRFSASAANRPGFAYVNGKRLDFTGFGNVALSKNDGEGRYQALILTASKFSETGFGFASTLTFGQAKDSAYNERDTFGSTSGTANSADPLSLVAYSDVDRRVRFTFATYFPVAYGIKGSANYSYTTGRPFTPGISADINGDTLTNDPDPNFGRNTARQPHVKSLDVRFSRDFQVSKRFRIETFVDIFNLPNWANWRTTFTTYRSSLTGTPFSDYGYLNQPDRGTRETQLGARFRF